MKSESDPSTLQQAIQFFSNPDRALAYFVARRWPDGVACPTCGRKDARYLANQRKWQCKSVHPKRQFTAKVGTIMEDSALPLEKWMAAIWLLSNCKNGISSHELARHLGITQKSAWFMLHRIRFAMRVDTDPGTMGGPGGGEVEVDETYIGPTPRNMHRARRIKAQVAHNFAPKGERGHYAYKIGVQGILDRETRQIRTTVLKNAKRDSLQAAVLENVAHGSNIYTDQHVSYAGLADRGFVHQVVNHLERYVDGRVHTNGLENYWSLFKRTLRGTYVAVEPFHLERYADEQAFRFNFRRDGERKMTDAERFNVVLSGVAGRRLTYEKLTGKEGETAF